ncbi:MAG TPA: hypothetical protein VFO10_22310 [Oligoflexus sp.]|uniref:hypothetical protein n=1 Tax=Oligoflexus sp. TaxID=1971216 RepID=UPI002D7F3A7E|nr:hypothetical protein [Oligoflexus sp.]HET9240012.1 hypothetical protein [Oligoflexus sp.]
MRYQNSIKYSLWARYKKKIIVIGVTLMALFALVIGGVGYAVYQSAVFAKETLQTWNDPQNPSPGDANVVLPNRGWMEGFVISVGSLWLQQNLAEQDTAQLKNGLSCFDAIGGPSPVEMVNLVKTRVSDARITKELDSLAQNLQDSGPGNPGPAACATWMLNG